MKTTSAKILIILIFGILIFSCEKKETTTTPPDIPPVESMKIDFGQLAEIKSVDISTTNWSLAAGTVGFWSSIIGTTLVVPVSAFVASFDHQPTQIDNKTWQWQYDVTRFTSTYTARLVAKLQTDQVKWEMYISKIGINSFDEFLWFEGTSALDGNSGQWILYYSADFQDKLLQIDWQKDGENVGQVKYTYVREQNNQNAPDMYFGSTLTYGLQNKELDAYVNVHVYSPVKTDFTDINIEWSTTNFNGHIKSDLYYNDTDWHCWDISGNDIDCF